MVVHICMLTQVYELLITQLHIISIIFYKFLELLPFYTLLNVSCLISEYQYGFIITVRVLHLSQNKVNL